MSNSNNNPEADQLRELIREARETLKDLKVAKKDLENFIREGISERLDQEVGRNLIEFGITIQQEMQISVDKINKRFDTISNLMMGDGKKRARIEDLLEATKIMEAAEQQYKRQKGL